MTRPTDGEVINGLDNLAAYAATTIDAMRRRSPTDEEIANLLQARRWLPRLVFAQVMLLPIADRAKLVALMATGEAKA